MTRFSLPQASSPRPSSVIHPTFSTNTLLKPQVGMTPSDTGREQQVGAHHNASAEIKPLTGVRGER